MTILSLGHSPKRDTCLEWYLLTHYCQYAHLVQVLRNAGSRVKLLIARDLNKDNHLGLSPDSLDSKVCLNVKRLTKT